VVTYHSRSYPIPVHPNTNIGWSCGCIRRFNIGMHLLDIWSRMQWLSLHTTWYSKYICIVIKLGLTCYSLLLTSLNVDTQLDVMANCMHEQCYWTLDRFVNVAFVVPCQRVSLGLTYDATYDGCHLYNYTRNNSILHPAHELCVALLYDTSI